MRFFRFFPYRSLVVPGLLALAIHVSGTAAAASLDDAGRHVIPEITNAPEGAEVPAKLLEQTDLRELGESIAARVAKRRTIPAEAELIDGNRVLGGMGAEWVYKNFPLPPVADLQLHFYFQPELRLESILKHGILNVHQSAIYAAEEKPSGVFMKYKTAENVPEYVASRLELEEAMTGLKFPREGDPEIVARAAGLRPKSVILELGAHAPSVPKLEGGARYGAYVAKLKPAVLRRASLTSADSWEALAAGNWRRKIPERMSRFVQTPFQKEITFETGYASHAYIEAQVWGPLALDDIEEFWVPKQYAREAVGKLKQTGIPIRLYEERQGADVSYGRKAGRLLYPGDDKRRSTWQRNHDRKAASCEAQFATLPKP